MSIRFLITGGTIDKVYQELDGSLGFEQTHLVEMLNRGRCMADTLSEVLYLKDSLEMDEADRELILSKCQSCDESQIVISHGTDTMVETAQYLAKHVTDKTIVLFGAMIPYVIDNSDALFNLGVALGAVQSQAPGVYVAMNGRIFDCASVQKNKALGIFENT